MTTMLRCKGIMPSVITLFDRIDPHLRKIMGYRMSYFHILIIFLIFGLTAAYLFTYITVLLYPVYNGRTLLVSSSKGPSHFGTSLIKRQRQQTLPVHPEVKKEAVAAMNLALDMEAQGKHEKAMKLFLHALNLDPLHVDILTSYGEFLEHHEKDVVKAEKLYSKALLVCPDHTKALANRKRILPLVEEIDQRMYNAIDQKLDILYKIPSNHPGLRRQKKEAYFNHIYHTNAIEGNTLTLAQTRSIVETGIAIGGKSLIEQQEVLGLDSALSFVNNTLLGRVGQLKMQDILDIHKRVLGFVDPIEGGRFRTTQVFVADFIPPPPDEVHALMEDFVEWLNSEEALALHPLEYAAIAHYKLVVIHPFYDGNGRTSRLLMNLILMQVGFPPVTIRVEDRARYYETLEDGNQGDLRSFIRFIAECAERTLDEFLLATLENPSAVLPHLQLNRNKTRSNRVIYADP